MRQRRMAGHSEGGSAAIEFAIVAPLLLLLLFAVVQFGFMWNRHQGLQAAAREGGRAASISTSTAADVTARVIQAMDGVAGGPLAAGDVAISPGVCTTATRGSTVTVTATSTAKIELGVYTATVPLVGKGSFRCE